jgi:hypothetical protein
MGFLAAARLWFATNPKNVWLIAGLIAVIAVLAFTYAKGMGDNARQERARDAMAEAAAIKSDTVADTKATDQQKRDAEVRAEKEKDLADAIAPIIDSVPDAAAVALGCERLRQAGVSTSDIPACATSRR